MKSLKENPMVTEMARKYKMDAKDVRNAILEKYRRAALNADAGTEEQMAFEPKHDEAVNKFDKEFYPFWEDYEGRPHMETSFVKDPAFGEITGRALLGTWQEREEQEHKLRSGEVGGTQFYKKPTYYTKKEFYPKDHPDKTLAEQLKSTERIRFENLRGLEDPLPEGGFFKGGRVPFVKGGMGRREFLTWLGSLVGGIAGIKSGLIKFGVGKGKGTVAVKVGDTIIKNTKGMPDWFIPLVNRITKEGDNVTKKLGTVEREIVHTKKIGKGEEVTVYQNMDTGNVRVEYGPHIFNKEGKVIRPSNDNQVVHLEYKAGEVIEEGAMKGKKTDPEFSAAEAKPRVTNWEGDIEWEHMDIDKNVGDLLTDTSKLKTFAKKKLTHKDKVIAKKKQKYKTKLEKDPSEQLEYIEKKEGATIDDLLDEGKRVGEFDPKGYDPTGEVKGMNLPDKKIKKASGGSVDYDTYLPDIEDID